MSAWSKLQTWFKLRRSVLVIGFGNHARRPLRFGLLIGAVACAAIGLTACSSSSSSGSSSSSAGKTVSINLGGGETLNWKTGQQLKIAYFEYASTNAYLQAAIAAAKAEAQKIGASITVFDAQGDPQTQYNQMQTALATGGYDAWIINAVSGTLICNIASKQAPAKGIAVVNQDDGICGRFGQNAGTVRAPGVYGFIGGTNSLDDWTAFANYIGSASPGATNAIVLSGSAGQTTALVSQEAFTAMEKKFPNIHIVETLSTDFTEQDGFNLTQQAIQQHRNVNAIISVYSDLTQGAIKALQAAGDAGKIKIYDQGGDTQSVAAIKAGTQVMSMAIFPASQASGSVELLNKLNLGQVTTPQVIWNDGSPQSGPDGGPLFITKSSVSSFTPQYG
jgi:ribose transport system substrate-binding protein